MAPAQPHLPAGPRRSPRGGAEHQIWQLLLRSAVRAPSGHNTQPWRFHIVDGHLYLYADRRRSLPVVDPEDRELVMSCGAALAHLIVALRHFGYTGEVTPLPDPADRDLLASVGLGDSLTPGPDDHGRFEAIGNRHTHRSAFDARPVPRSILAQLVRDALRIGATLHPVTSSEQKETIAALVAAGDRAQFHDHEFRGELAAWIRPNRTHRDDGMPGYAFGISNLASLLGPTMITAFDAGFHQARKDELLARTAPALLILSTPGDTPADWLMAGQAVALVLLRGTSHGLSASFLNQPVEVPALRIRLRDLLGAEHPQLLLRIGYAANDRPTPRRAVADVLTDAHTRMRDPS